MGFCCAKLESGRTCRKEFVKCDGCHKGVLKSGSQTSPSISLVSGTKAGHFAFRIVAQVFTCAKQEEGPTAKELARLARKAGAEARYIRPLSNTKLRLTLVPDSPLVRHSPHSGTDASAHSLEIRIMSALGRSLRLFRCYLMPRRVVRWVPWMSAEASPVRLGRPTTFGCSSAAKVCCQVTCTWLCCAIVSSANGRRGPREG